MSATESETRKWELILSDSSAPAELLAEAHAQLGLPPEASEYHAGLDAAVQSFWHRAKGELEKRDSVAEATYHSLVSVLILGGTSSTIGDDARRLLGAFRNCKSDWAKTHFGRALELVCEYHADEVAEETLASLREALG